ncbi:hypothetical protein [Halobacterium sp. CBA1126]|uniref:hypothetical protein n=1 Tax=Halobacterium sp. CBA1126 TaxID=2668074 RepID=UPI0012F7654E|nr:hypothetical protein [Halobacterium sp. CBA1126]MUV60922.1 hypothetical protein [Halobacterium sp. CBA1126]
MVAGVSVDPALRTVGSLSVGGAFACLTGLAVTGAFLPGSYGEDAAKRVSAAR